MKKISALFLLFFIMFTAIANAANLKLYRNEEYQFSIKIPYEFQYRTPRGPNVKMLAGDTSGANMNIIIKPIPIKDSDEIFLKEILNIQKAQRPASTFVINEGITDINNIKAAWTFSMNKYKNPKSDFTLALLSYQFITNYKYYCITYCASPDTYILYEPLYIDSISSFVDETGWY